MLFDLFGVIAYPQSTEGWDRLVDLTGASVPALWDAYWALRPPYDRAEVTGPEYWRQVAGALGSRFDDDRIAALVEADIDSWSRVDTRVIALIEELGASDRRLALLSNIPEELAAHYEARHSWFDHFRVRGFSCRIGHAKPDPDAYRWCLDALGTEPDRVLFVDDRPENVRAAEAIGLAGHLFTTPGRLRNALSAGGR